jgi:hypothetical protein
MPHQRVMPPKLDAITGSPAALPEYVLVVREDLVHDAYRLHSSFPEGKIYEVIR